ncbi:hypothetical protein LTR28_008566 [Elasticomyces elasticus]|nr:hypothetical protein LTR28_008566 [Elasticomyces elasticus]
MTDKRPISATDESDSHDIVGAALGRLFPNDGTTRIIPHEDSHAMHNWRTAMMTSGTRTEQEKPQLVDFDIAV